MNYDFPELTMFAKLNLAKCAQARAVANRWDGDRFTGEYNTVRMWMRHSVVQSHTLAGQPMGYCA
jgi:hypothetical protein